ncbi:MAG: hypothetical protein CSA25_03000 [Desulfobacter postgatei]|uniref:CopG family transcriptional regulator n=1 Tax=Desulfobacter postgatei TaxID=2293 RepID=A0A2G6MS15_9BACT|nr:MAG: hypothetical protein CSA25_03000 [Desulfobacter postgatei]
MEIVKQGPMRRKPILMPLAMIEKVNSMAQKNNISFAEVVRNAVDAFHSQSTIEEDALLESLADTMIETTKNLVGRIDELEARINKTHAILERR